MRFQIITTGSRRVYQENGCREEERIRQRYYWPYRGTDGPLLEVHRNEGRSLQRKRMNDVDLAKNRGRKMALAAEYELLRAEADVDGSGGLKET